MYQGEEPIIFDSKPIPNLKNGIKGLNEHDMRGVIVRATKEFMKVEVGMLGIVYEIYQDFDYPEKYGWSVIFESGSYDGFSVNDREEIGFFEVVGVYPPAQNYEFTNVVQLEKDFQVGVFKFK